LLLLNVLVGIFVNFFNLFRFGAARGFMLIGSLAFGISVRLRGTISRSLAVLTRVH
jgi:hypothetical protein